MFNIINTLIALCFIVGVICLQVFLSKKSNKCLGLIIPIMSFAFSILRVLNVMDTGNLWQNIKIIVSSLLILNIFTFILLVIYFVCKEKLKKEAQLEKMNVQDLE